MCGIVGYLERRNCGQALNVDSALRALAHRGPDESGSWSDPGIALGHTRLSIIDLSAAGHQPMASPDDRYVIAFNGEVYNFGDLRSELEAKGEVFSGHSDTEVLLRLVARDGFTASLGKLRGMFAFAVWDRETRTLSLARDRLGVKPLVYAQNDRGFAFASEIQALFVLDPGLSRQADWAAIDHYLTYQYIPAPMTGFVAIRKLEPGHAMTVKEGRVVSIWRYWNPDPAFDAGTSFGEACEQVRETFLEATRIRLVSDVPLGAFLSGGLDSSIVVAAMSRLGVGRIKTFSIGFEDENLNELPFARQVAQHVGADHHEMIVRADAAEVLPSLIRHFGEPMADSSAIPTYYVSKLARSQVTVALTGDGGDESFAGYRRHYHAALAERIDRSRLMPVWRLARRVTAAIERKPYPHSRADQGLMLSDDARYKHLLAYFTDAEKSSIVTPAFRDKAAHSKTTAVLTRWFEEAAQCDAINRYLHVDRNTYLPNDVLAKVDTCSMMNSLECRSPLLDHKLVELAMGYPGHYKMKWPHRHKHLLKEAFKSWLPPGFLERRKMGFSVPLGRWLRNDLSELLRERLLAESTLTPWVDAKVLERYVGEHLSGESNHSKQLWSLLVLAEWMKIFAVTP